MLVTINHTLPAVLTTPSARRLSIADEMNAIDYSLTSLGPEELRSAHFLLSSNSILL